MSHPAGPVDARREALIVAAVLEGVRTYEDIGAEWGITKERIRQIAVRAGVDRHHVPVPALPRHGPRRRCVTCRDWIARGELRRHRIASGHTIDSHGVVTQAEVDAMKRLYIAGLGYKLIARKFGVSHLTVKRWVVGYAGTAPHKVGSRLSARRIAEVLATA